jgi:hypothetical protein
MTSHVKRWTKPTLQASAMRCGLCCDTEGVIGVDMIAEDGTTFAHGHFDIRTAVAFKNQLIDAINEACK